MQTPLVSVIMPVFNAEKFLAESIESILSQTYNNLEFIIIDDCSTDNSIEIIKKIAKKDKRIKLLTNIKKSSISESLNKGIKKSGGKYLVRMDADDWSYPDRIAKQVAFMEEHRDVAVCGGTIEVCNEKLVAINTRSYPLTDKEVRQTLFRYSPFAHPATIWDAKSMKQIGGYNERIPYAQDYESYFRIGLLGKFANLSDTVLKLRTHESSCSMKMGRIQEHFTLYARIKAFLEYKYPMTTMDKLYSMMQLVSMFVIPQRVKFWVFNYIRRYF